MNGGARLTILDLCKLNGKGNKHVRGSQCSNGSRAMAPWWCDESKKCNRIRWWLKPMHRSLHTLVGVTLFISNFTHSKEATVKISVTDDGKSNVAAAGALTRLLFLPTNYCLHRLPLTSCLFPFCNQNLNPLFSKFFDINSSKNKIKTNLF